MPRTVNALRHLPALPLCAGAVTAISVLTGLGAVSVAIALICLAATAFQALRNTRHTLVTFFLGMLAATWSVHTSRPPQISDILVERAHKACAEIHSVRILTNSWAALATVDSIDNAPCAPFRCRVIFDNGNLVAAAGDRVRFSAAFEPTGKHSHIPALDQTTLSEMSDGIAATAFVNNDNVSVAGNSRSFAARMDACRRSLADAVYNSPLSPRAAALLTASCLGTADANLDTKELYKATGLSHLLCVSGFHLALAAWLMSLLLWPLKLWAHAGRIRHVILIAGIWVYAALTGLQPSAVRAATMLSLYCLCRLIQIPVNPFNTLLLALAVILISKPCWLYSAGLQLSVAAVCGLLMFTHKINPIPAKYRVLHTLAESFAVPAAAMLGALPAMLFWFGSMPVAALPVNAVVSAIFPLFMAGGSITVALHNFGLHFSAATALTEGLNNVIEAMCRFGTEFLPLASGKCVTAVEALFIIAATAAFAATLHTRHRRRIAAGAATVIFAAVPLVMPARAESAIAVHSSVTGTSVCLHNHRQAAMLYTGRSSNSYFVARIAEVAGVSADNTAALAFNAEGVAAWHNQTIALASKCQADSVGFLLVDRRCKTPADSLLNRLRPGTVLVCADVAPNRRAAVENACRKASIPCHNLARKTFYTVIRQDGD